MNQPVQNTWWLPHLWRLLYGGLGILVTVLLLDRGAVLWVDRAWFASLGYESVLAHSLLWRLGMLLLGFAIALTVLRQNIRRAWKRPHQPSLWMLLWVASGGFAWFLQQNWWTVATWLHQVPVGEQDPVFGRDLGFYLFALPFWEMAQGWAFRLIAVTLGAVAVVYVTELGLAKQRLTVALTLAAQRHLLTLTGSLLVALAWGHALSRFQLLYSTRGTIFGASFTDVNAQLPANTLLSGVALLTAGGLLWVGVGQLNPAVLRAQKWVGNPRRPWVRSVVVPLVLLMAYWGCTGPDWTALSGGGAIVGGGAQ
ncbi:MAG: COG1615 family transporter [Synechococcaceae cyanobacterium SM2_3_2]|nr:COG1615 family transporter [Synechococcaceae cyanobacterium SM2_3_2]